LNKFFLGYEEYKIYVYDFENDLIDIYKATSESEKDMVVKKHFRDNPEAYEHYVIYQKTIAIEDKRNFTS